MVVDTPWGKREGVCRCSIPFLYRSREVFVEDKPVVVGDKEVGSIYEIADNLIEFGVSWSQYALIMSEPKKLHYTNNQQSNNVDDYNEESVDYNIIITDNRCEECGCQYRAFKDRETLEKYKLLVFQTKLDKALKIKTNFGITSKGE
jgi:hypothetical protein